MPIQGGVFSRIKSWVQEYAAGNSIDPGAFDQDANDMAAAINTALFRDGSNKPTADLPMNGFALTGLRAGTKAGESVTFDQVNSLISQRSGLITGVAAVNSATAINVNALAKELVVTGPQALITLSADQGNTVLTGFYFFVTRRDGQGGAATFTPGAGTVDGLASISIYQESFMLFFDGTNWFTAGRQRGWIGAGDYIAPAVASITIAAPFADPEISRFQLSADNFTLATSLVAGIKTAAGDVRTNGFQVGGAAAPMFTPSGSTTGLVLCSSSGGSTARGNMTLTNLRSQAVQGIGIEASNITNGTVAQTGLGYLYNVAGPLTSVVLSAGGLNLTGVGISSAVFRD